jgi:hypothetical protein
MKSILINSQTREVKEVTLADVLKDSYALIGCSMVETGEYINQNDALMIDEEGYFKQGQCGFFYGENFYYGNAVIWGTNPEDGDNADCSVTAEQVLASIYWVDAHKASIVRDRVLSRPFTFVAY